MIRSFAFNVVFYVWTLICCVGIIWILVIPRKAAIWVVCRYLDSLHLIELLVLRLDYRVVGKEHLPDGPYILAAKHQSTWETMKLHLLVDDPAVILKRELMLIPLWGWYAAKAQMIPVHRGGRSKAIASIIEGAKKTRAQGRPIAIFPQGTRTAAGTFRPYRVGVAAIYEALDLPVVPMALNSGVFWPRRKFIKRAGTITVEFLPPIPPGLARDVFLKRLEDELESATDRLVTSVGGPATDRSAPVDAPVPEQAVASR